MRPLRHRRRDTCLQSTVPPGASRRHWIWSGPPRQRWPIRETLGGRHRPAKRMNWRRDPPIVVRERVRTKGPATNRPLAKSPVIRTRTMWRTSVWIGVHRWSISRFACSRFRRPAHGAPFVAEARPHPSRSRPAIRKSAPPATVSMHLPAGSPIFPAAVRQATGLRHCDSDRRSHAFSSARCPIARAPIVESPRALFDLQHNPMSVQHPSLEKRPGIGWSCSQ